MQLGIATWFSFTYEELLPLIYRMNLYKARLVNETKR